MAKTKKTSEKKAPMSAAEKAARAKLLTATMNAAVKSAAETLVQTSSKDSAILLTFGDSTQIVIAFNVDEQSQGAVSQALQNSINARRSLVESELGGYIKKSDVLSTRKVRFDFLHKGQAIESFITNIMVANKALDNSQAVNAAVNAVFLGWRTSALARARNVAALEPTTLVELEPVKQKVANKA